MLLAALVAVSGCDAGEPEALSEPWESRRGARGGGEEPEPGIATGTFAQGSTVSSGQFHYRIPIQVPPGRGGMEPALGLGYHSGSSVGSTGYVGWSLEGLSQITRCAKVPLRDGISDNVAFLPTDNFCLDGAKLVALGEQDWTLPEDLTLPANVYMGGAYAPEDSSGRVRAIALMESLGGQELLRTWVVLRPNKRYEWFGETENSREWANQSGSGAAVTAAWLISGAQHGGNRIDYAYREDPSNCQITNPSACDPTQGTGLQQAGRVIEEITYTDWVGDGAVQYGGPASLRSVTFEWGAAVPSSHRDRWVDGVRLLHTEHLNEIAVRGPGGALVRSYRLNPTDASFSFRTGRELLLGVTLCDANGACLPETSFEYTTDTEPGDPYTKNVRFAHVEEFPLAAEVGCTPRTINIADVDGNGFDDIFYINDPDDPHENNESIILRSTGVIDTGTFASPTYSNSFVNFGSDKFFDIDRDLQRELLNVSVGGGAVTFGAYHFSNNSFVKEGQDLEVSGYDVQPANVTLDLDGDGQQELVVFRAGNDSNGYVGYQLNIYSHDGEGWSDGFMGWTAWDTTISTRFAGALAVDINGDGRTELVFHDSGVGGGRYLTVNDSGVLTTAWLGFGLEDFVFVDLNGDGLPEALRFTQHTEEQIVRINTGNGFLPPESYTGPSIFRRDLTGVRIADFNEDGRQDVLLLSKLKENHAELWLSNGRLLIRSPSFDEGQALLAYTGWDPASPLAQTNMPQWKAEEFWKGVKLLDANADGLLELAVVSWGYDDDCQDHSIRHLSQVESREGRFADRLIGVTNPLGGTESVSYGTLATSGTACENTLTDEDEQPLPTLVHCERRGIVVDEHQVDFSDNAPRVEQYAYHGARVDLGGRGWLGFERIEEYEPTPRERRTLYFDQGAHDLCEDGTCSDLYAYPLAHTPREVVSVIEDAAGTPLFTATTRHDRRVVSVGPQRYRVQLEGIERADVHESPVEQTRIQTTSYSDFDEWGFAGTEDHEVVGGSSVRVERDYDPHQPDEALFGLVSSEIRTYSRPGASDQITTESRQYDGLGRMTEHVVAPTSSDPALYSRTEVSYDGGQLPYRVERFNIDATESRVMELGWSGDGAFVTSRTNGLGESVSMTHYPQFGVRKTLTDPNGLVTQTLVDSFGRPVEVQAPDGRITTYAYEKVNNLYPYGVTVSSGDGRWSQQMFDTWMRPSRTKRSGPIGTPIVQDLSHDDAGRIHKISTPYEVGDLPVGSVTYGYDDLGRAASMTTADGALSQILHEGFETKTMIDPVGVKTVSHFDADGSLAMVEQLDAGSVVMRSTTYEHDARGRFTFTDDGSPDGWLAVAYDLRGRVHAVESPDAGEVVREWNSFGQLTYSHRASLADGTISSSSTYAYDPVGRLTLVTQSDQGMAPRTNEYVYGGAPGQDGRLLAQMRDNDADGVHDVVTEFGYDTQGRLASRQTEVGGMAYLFEFGYDVHGRIETLTYPEADGISPVVGYHYNPWGTLDSMTNESPTSDYGGLLWKANDFDIGLLSDSQKGYELETERIYDPATRRLESITTSAGAQPVYDKAYTYYDDGRILSMVDGVEGITETMTYDALGRLTVWDRVHATNSLTREFSYDDERSGVLSSVLELDGSATPVDDVSYEFNGATPHAVSRMVRTDLTTSDEVETTFVDDALGREVQELHEGQIFREIQQFNGFDLPDEMVVDGEPIVFMYDSEGRRASWENANTGERTVSVDDLYEHRMPTGGEQEIHVYFIDSPEGRIGQWSYDTEVQDFELSFFETDVRGSVDLVSAPNGQTLERRFYSPFGIDLDEAGYEVSLIDGPGYATHSTTAPLELIDMKARLYNPHKRRFLSTDPVFLGFDGFAYAHDDPINRIDPDGRCDSLGHNCPPIPWISQPPADHNEGMGPGQDAPPSAGNSGSGGAHSIPSRPTYPSPPEAPGPGGVSSSEIEDAACFVASSCANSEGVAGMVAVELARERRLYGQEPGVTRQTAPAAEAQKPRPPTAYLFGVGVGAFSWIGVEEGFQMLWIPGRGPSFYYYEGIGLGTPGASVSADVGVVHGVSEGKDYAGPFVSMDGGVNFAGGVGVHGNGFWYDDVSGGAGGLTMGSPGLSATYTGQDYWHLDDPTVAVAAAIRATPFHVFGVLTPLRMWADHEMRSRKAPPPALGDVLRNFARPFTNIGKLF